MVTTIIQNLAASCNTSFFGLPTWYKYLVDPTSSTCEVSFSLIDGDGKFAYQDILLLSLGILDILIRLAAIVAVAFVVVGGFKLLTSQGEPEGVKAGRNTVLNAFIGLIVAIIAATVVAFIGRELSS